MKRLLIIAASVIFLIGLAFGVYMLFGPKDAELETEDGVVFDPADDAPYEDPTEGATGPVKAGEEIAPRLIRITGNPVAQGAAIFALPSRVVPGEDASSTPQTLPGDTEIRYVDRASGNFYAYRFHERTLERIANRTLPGIQEASWLSDGSLAYVRFLGSAQGAEERAETYALPSSGEGGYFLEKGLSQATVIGTSTLFTLMPSTGGSVGTISNADGTNPRTLFTAAMANLIVHLSDGPYMAHTKASAHIDGYAFTISSGGAFTRVLGPHKGLTILPSPSGSLVLYSYAENRTLRMFVLNRATGQTTALPLATLPEKCAWTSDSAAVYCGVPRAITGTLPDEWYQGAVQFSDRLWRIDMNGRVATLVIDPATAGESVVDITAPAIDGKNDVLTFRNKLDGSLWAYDL